MRRYATTAALTIAAAAAVAWSVALGPDPAPPVEPEPTARCTVAPTGELGLLHPRRRLPQRSKKCIPVAENLGYDLDLSSALAGLPETCRHLGSLYYRGRVDRDIESTRASPPVFELERELARGARLDLASLGPKLRELEERARLVAHPPYMEWMADVLGAGQLADGYARDVQVEAGVLGSMTSLRADLRTPEIEELARGRVAFLEWVEVGPVGAWLAAHDRQDALDLARGAIVDAATPCTETGGR